jgi:hypothetical protein
MAVLNLTQHGESFSSWIEKKLEENTQTESTNSKVVFALWTKEEG